MTACAFFAIAAGINGGALLALCVVLWWGGHD